MEWEQVLSICPLIKEIESNIQGLGESIKSLNFEPFSSSFGSFLKFTSSTQDLTSVRYNTLHRFTQEMAKNIYAMNSHEHKRWVQLLNDINQLEKFYANQAAIFKVLSSDYKKRTKKRIRQAYNDAISHPHLKLQEAEESIANDVTSYFQKIASIQYLIHYRLFLCFKNYEVSRAQDYKTFLEKYDKNFPTMCSIIESTVLPQTDLNAMMNNPRMYCIKDHEPITTFFTFHRPQSVIPKNKINDKADESQIAWSPLKAKSTGCIHLNPEDEVGQISEDINGTNMTKKSYFL
ncbi:hypothetical protein RF11_16295 [Thelohanellus kitauei]|uniref:Uncharacterized protein n=1 Tax=Thelohanellus kitauei TaxID=669202 RepID=A0A0C2MN33_THEKT|nr:hypothetical protein RF11_16295 [Thelohanellus kitauei]